MEQDGKQVLLTAVDDLLNQIHYFTLNP